MSKQPSLITNRDLQSHHIEHHAYSTDSEYANIARNLLKRLTSVNTDKFEPEILRDIAIRLALHLEDTLADAGPWRSFCTEHHRLYGEWLPFGWAKNEPALDEVTLESCQFVIWMTIVRNEGPRYISPNTPAVRKFAEVAFDYLDSIFEDTSINEQLLHDLYSEDTLTDFIEVRRVLTWLANPFGCYLSDWDVTRQHIVDEMNELDKRFKGADSDVLQYAAMASFPFKEQVGPLALMPKDWYAIMLETYPEPSLKAAAQKVRAMDFKPYTLYYIKKDTDNHILFQDKEGSHFEVSHSSFGLNFDCRPHECDVAESSFVFYDGIWHNNGISAFHKLKVPFSEVIRKHKEEQDSHLRARDYFEHYVATQNGRRLYYFDGFNSLKQWLQNEVIHQDPTPMLSNMPSDMRESNDITVFLPTDGDPEFLWGHTPSIADPLNPLYDPEDDCAIDIFDNSDSVHGECLRYMLSHGMMRDCRFYYGDTQASCQTLFQSNIDFLARFYRRGAY